MKEDSTTKLDQMEMEAWVRALIREKDEFYHIYECYSAGELPIKAMQSAASILNCFPKKYRPEIRKNEKKTGLLLFWQIKQFQVGFSVREEGWRYRFFVERV